MKLFKKNQKGMTLVEVVLAIAMFSVMTLAVTYAFSAAMQFNKRNMLRDKELNTQQAALERGSAAGIALNDGNSFKTAKIQYSGGGFTTKEVSGITQYKAIKTAGNGNTYNFELHTASATPFGGVPTKVDKDNGYFGIQITNETSERWDVILVADSGKYYEGNYDNGVYTDNNYVHPSLTYSRSLEAKGIDNSIYDYDPTGKTPEEIADLQAIKDNSVPHSFMVGYFNDGASFSIDVYVRNEAGAQALLTTITESNFSTNGKVSIDLS